MKGDHASPFHRKHAMPGGTDRFGDLDRRTLGDLLDRAILTEFDEDVVAPVLVDERRAWLAGLDHVGHDRQFLEFDRDRAGDVLGFRACGATHIAIISPT